MLPMTGRKYLTNRQESVDAAHAVDGDFLNEQFDLCIGVIFGACMSDDVIFFFHVFDGSPSIGPTKRSV